MNFTMLTFQVTKQKVVLELPAEELSIRSKKVYTGNYTNLSAPVKSKDGSTIKNESEQTNRWVEHLCEVLNHPSQMNPPTPTSDK